MRLRLCHSKLGKPVELGKLVSLLQDSLTDGRLNAGITEPDRVEALTRAGMEKDEIRTSCLGFGDGYNKNVLAAISKVGQGQLHDADSPEKFPVILADELDGL